MRKPKKGNPTAHKKNTTNKEARKTNGFIDEKNLLKDNPIDHMQSLSL